MLKQLLQPYQDQLDLLCAIPGIKWDAAAAIFIELGGNLSEFPNARSFAAWSNTAPGNNESAGKRRGDQTRHGNPHLQTTLNEVGMLKDFARQNRLPVPENLGAGVVTMAMIAGYLNRKSDPPPEHKKNWEGYITLVATSQAMT